MKNWKCFPAIFCVLALVSGAFSAPNDDEDIRIVKVNDSNFEQEILQSDKPTILEFSSTSCPPCLIMIPTLISIAKNYPDIKLQKYDSYANAKNAFENGNGVAWANDNTEVIAFALQNTGYTVGIPSLGSQDTIAPAVSKGNESLLNWLNEEIKVLGEEQFFHAAYEATLADTYGLDYEESLVVEGGVTK